MKQWEYETLEHYTKIQIARRNLKKSKQRTLNYYKNQLKFFLENVGQEEINSVICHGVRNPFEVNCFKNIFSEAEITGTDIAFADEEKNIFKYDFAELPEKWSKKFDLTYSNSVDHSFDIVKTLKEWKRTTKKYMAISFPAGKVSSTDPFSFDSKEEFIELLDELDLELLNLDKFFATIKIGDKKQEV